MKLILSSVFCLMAFICTAQKMQPYPSSDSIAIKGLVNEPVVFSINDLNNMPDTSFPILRIVNNHGEFKANYKQVKAVSLKKLLDKSLLTAAKPKEKYSFYFVCKAMDGYSVVYSFNELFKDSPEIFVVTAYDDLNMTNMPEKPIILTLTGTATGRMGMRGLKSIEVKKAE
ncbi:MAG: hypothetical protein QM737_20240 [Ferruginibacter sp.]